VNLGFFFYIVPELHIYSSSHQHINLLCSDNNSFVIYIFYFLAIKPNSLLNIKRIKTLIKLLFLPLTLRLLVSFFFLMKKLCCQLDKKVYNNIKIKDQNYLLSWGNNYSKNQSIYILENMVFYLSMCCAFMFSEKYISFVPFCFSLRLYRFVGYLLFPLCIKEEYKTNDSSTNCVAD
jgi:hypothetical protein